jgi:polysaccharide pyruvyl transferase WcaK-like protein
MKNVRVLHLASFDGNIGDNANHFGFYKHLHDNQYFNYEIDKLEIREFYWKKRFFDGSFVSLVNQYDLLIIGGGNYFELWVEDSPTGTSIAIELDLLKNIQTPIFFNSLGVDPGQGASEIELNKFRRFLNTLIERNDFISVRNDGAINTLSNLVGEQYLSNIVSAPDAGFFVEVDPAIKYFEEKKYIAINVATDMEDVRFNKSNCDLNYNDFLKEFVIFVSVFLTEFVEYEIVFVPHIFRDITFINDILLELDDDVRRRKISVAPLLHGDESHKYVMSIYDSAKLILGNRFHANVCGFGLGTPTIGLVNYIQIENLYREVNNSSVVDVSKNDFHADLLSLVNKKLTAESGKDFSVRDEMAQKYNVFMDKFLDWARGRI